jgi:hypothetical protein
MHAPLRGCHAAINFWQVGVGIAMAKQEGKRQLPIANC